MVAEDMALFPYTNNLIKKYPKQSKKFIIYDRGKNIRVQKNAFLDMKKIGPGQGS